MVSEDSVQYLIHGPLALLAVHVHRIRDIHDGSQAGRAEMCTELVQTHRVFEQLDIRLRGMKSRMYRRMKGSTCLEIIGRDMIANTSTSGFPDLGEIRPHPKTSWAISRSSRRHRC